MALTSGQERRPGAAGTIPTALSRHQQLVRLAWKGGAAALTLAVLVAGTLLVVRWVTDDSCGSGVRKAGPAHECVGVTDGSYVYSKELADVERQIHDENQAAEGSGRYVSVAVFLPMTLGAADSSTIGAVREELQGAVTAQHRANNGPELGTFPKIKLLLANSGSRSEQWQEVTDRLLKLVDSADRLVAVTGFGQSLDTVQSALRKLRTAGVPTVGSTITADDYADAKQAGFFRVAPSNSDEGQAAAGYLKGRLGAGGGRVLVVADHNSHDDYSASLRKGFVAAAGRVGLPLTDSEETYLSTAQGTGNAFLAMKEDICVTQPAAVYFAGRGRDLGDFVTAMAERQCLGKGRITVVSGDDAVSMRQDPQLADALQKGQLDILFTALANPQEWANEAPDSPDRQNFEIFRNAFTEHFADPQDLRDGQAMMSYDATLAAVLGIRFAAGSSGETPVTPTLALQGLLTRSGEHSVPGASGRIDLLPDGNARNKAMALVQIQPDGSYLSTAVVRPLTGRAG